MKFSYKFNNLLGAVYKEGDLLFSPDGNSVISPVGNRITIYDLKSNKAFTLPVESSYNYTTLAISPNGCILIAVNESGVAQLISLISKTVVHKYEFHRIVHAVKFSPDGKHFAVCKESKVFIFKAPKLLTGQFNSFVMERVFSGASDETTCLDWSYDSNVLAVGSKDMSTKLYTLNTKQVRTLSTHSDVIVGCFFEKDSLDLSTISRNGRLCIWECSIEANDLFLKDVTEAPTTKKRHIEKELEEDEIDATKVVERTESEMIAALSEINIDGEKEGETVKFYYKRLARHYLADEVRKDNHKAIVTSAMYHKQTKILVTGFSTGAFFIHELPDVNLIHSLSISNQAISGIAINNTGEWIALGCGGLGQLLVWEWQSETYVMKQQGHSNNMSCLCYSPDGQLLATGGQDGKLKLWNVHSGFCFVTFEEHSSAISAVTFGGNKKFVLSASLDGTVRAYDLTRYRNFRTLTTPRPIQLSCIAVDSSGEFVAAGGQDVFEIYLWSMKLNRLLEILSGHEAPVVSVAFSSLMTSTVLASVSWDKTLRIWNAIEKGSQHESVELTADGLCVTFKPDGREVAVATLDGQISFFDVQTVQQSASIEGRGDLWSGKSDTHLIGPKKLSDAKAFTSICYSADGKCLLAGGQSRNVCIYSIEDGLLMKKFQITHNKSFDEVDDFINRRKMTEFGNIALVEKREEAEGGNVTIRLPGVRKGDMASRSFKPEINVFSLQFSPTGHAWAAATTEGLLIYALSTDLIFDPWELQLNITPAKVKAAIDANDHVNALMMAMKLNETELIQEVLEQIPMKDVELTIRALNERYVERLVIIIANLVESSRHVEFYLHWAQNILSIHGPTIKWQKNLPALLSLNKSLNRKYEQLSKLCDFNKYTMQFISRLGEASTKKEKSDSGMEVEEEVDSESEGSLFSDIE